MKVFKGLVKAAVTAALLATTAVTASAQSTIDDIRDRGVLRMAGILNEDPYFSKDPRSGEWRGFAVAMGANMAAELGVELEVVESSWSNSILDVQSGRVDIALALTALPKRALSIHFSSPTYYNSFVIISPNTDLAGKGWDELNDPNITIAVDIGSAQDNITRQYLPEANILRFKTRDEAIVAVITGQADGIINSVLNGVIMTGKNDSLGEVYVPQPLLSSPSVIGINYSADEQFKSFVSAWADYNRRVGNNQTWIVESMEPFGVALEDLPEGFDIGG